MYLDTHTLPTIVSQLEQMDVELHDVTPSLRTKLSQRLRNYQEELKRLNKEFVSHFYFLIMTRLLLFCVLEKVTSSSRWESNEI